LTLPFGDGIAWSPVKRGHSRAFCWPGEVLTVFGRSRNLVGLDIGDSSIKVVELKEQGKGQGYQLVRLGWEPLSSEAIVDGQIMDSQLVTETIQRLFQRCKIKSSSPVATALCGHHVIVKRISLPVMSDAELAESIHWEAEQYIPFDIDDVDLDFAILAEDEESDSMDVVLVAAKRERVDEHVAVIEAANRTATIMDIDAFAMQNAFEFSYPERQFEDVAILNLGSSVINMAVLEGGTPSFWRDIAIGMQQYVVALQRQFMLDAFDAEEVLRRAGSAASAGDDQMDAELGSWEADEGDDYTFDAAGADDTVPDGALSEDGDDAAAVGGIRDASTDPRVQEVVGEVSERLITEIKKTFDFYHAQSMRERFDAIFLAGGGAHITDLTQRLEQRLGTPVELLDPLRRVSIPTKSFDPEYVRSIAPQAAVAVGLAMRGEG